MKIGQDVTFTVTTTEIPSELTYTVSIDCKMPFETKIIIIDNTAITMFHLSRRTYSSMPKQKNNKKTYFRVPDIKIENTYFRVPNRRIENTYSRVPNRVFTFFYSFWQICVHNVIECTKAKKSLFSPIKFATIDGQVHFIYFTLGNLPRQHHVS